MKYDKFRLYSLTNPLYMSQIQVGIQTLHAAVDMLFKYKKGSVELGYAEHWAKKDKTVVILKGGPVGELINLNQEVTKLAKKLKLPMCSFCEDFYSLGGIITSVCIVVPECIYAAHKSTPVDEAPWIYENPVSKRKTVYTPDSSEGLLLDLLKSKPLA